MASIAAPLCSRGVLRCWQQVRKVSTAGTMCQERSREWRMRKSEQLRRNRRDPELEKKARNNQCKSCGGVLSWSLLSSSCPVDVPLETVHREWKRTFTGLQHLRNMATHCQLYDDVFGGVFTPSVFPEVVYDGGRVVEQGNLLAPRHVLQEPTVCVPQGVGEKYVSLVMTNPDGHLTHPHMELLHWMM